MLVILGWLLIAYCVPHYFWMPTRKDNKVGFVISELLLSGSLFVYTMYLNDYPTNFFTIPVLVIGYTITRFHYVLLPLVLLTPIFGYVISDSTLENALACAADFLLFLLFGFAFQILINLYKKNQNLLKLVKEQNNILTQYAKEIETLSVREERERLAKELHDTLGHSFISFIIGLDAVMAIVKSHPDLAVSKLEYIRDAASDQLDEVRSIVHQMGDHDNVSLSESVLEIIKKFSSQTNTEVNFQLNGIEYHTLQNSRNTLMRILQEALTNAKKHGNASRIDVTLEYHLQEISLVVKDYGVGNDGELKGFGLATMKERIDMTGGEFTISSSSKNGTVVKCTIPVKGVAVNG